VEDSKVLKRKLLIITVCGAIGALLGVGAIVVSNILYDMRHHMGPWVDTVSWLLMLPSMLVTGLIGEWPNDYLLYAAVGFVSFSTASAFWQFIMKPK
jgi:hypothetical protein